MITVSLHTGNPNHTNEVDYESYERQEYMLPVSFPSLKKGKLTVTHFAIRDHDGSIMVWGPLKPKMYLTPCSVPTLTMVSYDARELKQQPCPDAA